MLACGGLFVAFTARPAAFAACLGALADNPLSTYDEVLSSGYDRNLYENDENTSRTQSIPFNRQTPLADLSVGLWSYSPRWCGKLAEKCR
jgi:hypothetical protein